MKFLYLILYLSLISGCVKVTKKNADENSNTSANTAPIQVPIANPLPLPLTQEPPKVKSEENILPVNFKIEAGTKPHQYLLKVNWKSDFKKVRIENVQTEETVFTTDESKEMKSTSSTGNNFPNDNSSSDNSPGKNSPTVNSPDNNFPNELSSNAVIELKDDSHFKFNLFSLDSEFPQLISTIEGSTPKDYVVESNKELRETFQIDVERFFILNSAKIKTNGFDFIIHAKQFIVENAEILTFEQAPNNNPGLASNGIDGASGKSGGMIDVNAEYARGHLIVNLRGQSGGDGKNGEPYAERAPQGANGSPGGYTETQDYIDYPNDGHLHLLPFKLRYRCSKVKATNGSRGENGAVGRRGGSAGNGGSSGFLRMNIAQQNNFQVVVNREIGRAGRIGEGGAGQKGGLGGFAGVITPFPEGLPEIIIVDDRCAETLPGEMGQDGPPGQSGYPGVDGLLEKSCISISQGKENYCR